MAELLEILSNLNGVSGNENDVRNFIINEIGPYADDIKTDNMGNVISFKKGRIGKHTLFVSAHMDEVGFIISKITDDGFLKFKPVGNVEIRNIISKCIKINNTVDGIIGMKAIHLQKKDERETAVKTKELYIDIGAKDKDEAKNRIKLGNYVSFSTKAFNSGDKVIGKALTSRVGCACLIDAIKKEFDDNVYFAFTSQREVGMRGASVAAYGLKIDYALILDAVEAADMYGVEKHNVTAALGNGVCVDFMDKYAILNKTLSEKIFDELKSREVPVQKKQSSIGLTDAGAIQRSCEGIVTACITIPVRYYHTPCEMVSKKDISAMYDTLDLFIKRAGEWI